MTSYKTCYKINAIVANFNFYNIDNFSYTKNIIKPDVKEVQHKIPLLIPYKNTKINKFKKTKRRNHKVIYLLNDIHLHSYS